MQITGQLVQAESGMHVWAERYDGDLSDIFALQDEMTASVVGAVVRAFRMPRSNAPAASRSQNLDAYDLYLRALTGVLRVHSRKQRAGYTAPRTSLALDPNLVASLDPHGELLEP